MLASDPCESYFHQNMFVVQGIIDLWSGIAWMPCRLRGTFRLGRTVWTCIRTVTYRNHFALPIFSS